MFTDANDLSQLLWALFFVVLGGVFAIAQHRLFRVPRAWAFFLYVWHTAFCLIYVDYTRDNIADTWAYYAYSLESGASFGLGGDAVVAFTALFSRGLGMSYEGIFLVYNLIGFIGLIAMASALRTAVADKTRWIRQLASLVLLLPGFSFWSAAIGKDSIAFMAVGLILWSVQRIRSRQVVLIFAVVAMGCVRPHMAGLLTIALAFAAILAGSIPMARKVLLATLMVPVTAFAISLGLNYTGLDDASSINDIVDYVEQRQYSTFRGGSAVDIADMSIPERLFAFLFRPLFTEVPGLLGTVVSFENAILLVGFLSILANMVRRKSSLQDFERIFAFVFVAIAWTLLANTTANLGLAVRQKTMFTPMLVLLAFSYMRSIPAPANAPPAGTRRPIARTAPVARAR
ncbi:hypothetical protein MB02_14140 [Croceicoccus estronivorus]|uniref:hypothetical protein n=1 Tax=Croceicoccus estronivorus TaxID=1172626 RepID=UPI000832454C|nr:hypothetical protein [Croceicoccus estronivorus]OCC22905.1 hypothetical protein MB02_14140 [Croceicoccus estronivorus]